MRTLKALKLKRNKVIYKNERRLLLQSPFFAVKKFFLIFLIFFKNIKPSVKLNRLVSREEEIEVLYQTKKDTQKTNH